MRNNRTPLRILVVLLVCLLFIGGIAHAQSVTELRKKMNEAEEFVEEEQKEHTAATDHLNEMVGNFVTLHANLVNIKISAIPATSTWELAVALTQIVEALTKANLLTDAMETMLTNIETQREQCNTLWADVLLAQTAYEDAVDAYNAKVSPEEQRKTVEVPQPDPVAALYLCPGPCSMAFTTQVLATTSHKVFCDVPPHKGTNKYSYYSCPPDYKNLCVAKAFHKAPCRGGCGTLFETYSTGIPKDESHIKQCDERGPRTVFNLWTGNCIGKYYNCNGQTSADCNHAKDHISDDDEDDDSSASASLSGPSSASAGSRIQLAFSTPSAFSYVYWYVKSPSESGLGTRLDQVMGGKSSYSSGLGYSLPSSASGDYVFTAYVYNYGDTSVYEVSHTVSVSGSSTVQSSASLSGSSTASVGSRWTLSLRTTKPYSSVLWYLRDPGVSGLGRLVRAVSGGSGSYTSDFSYTFDRSGSNVVTAKVKHTDHSTSEVSHSVSVKLSVVPKQPDPKQPETKQPDPKEPETKQPDPKEPETKQPDPKEPETKQPETKEPETKPPPRYATTCSSGHTYNRNNSSDRKRHRDRSCARCGNTYQNCSNHSTACQGSKWHTEDPSAKPKPKTPTPTTPTPTTPTPTTPTPTTPTPPTPTPPKPTYHACGIHESSVSGDHSLQASCSEDSKCIATNFYKCQHTSHTYPAVSLRPCGHPTTRHGSHSWVEGGKCAYVNSAGKRCTNTSGYYRCKPHTHEYPSSKPKSACPADSWSNCGGSTSHAATCSAGHSYYTCASQSWHKDRTCTRCSQTYQDCTNSSSACQGSKWHTQEAITKPKPTTTTCARQECGETVSDRLAHKVSVCSSGCGNHYWTCIDGAEARHTKTYTCRREGCGQTFTKCTNHSTACVRAGKPSNYHWAK